MRLTFSAIISVFATAADAALQACTPASFSSIDVFGIEVVRVETTERHQYDDWRLAPSTGVVVDHEPIDFCNVTVTYTHPGYNDTIHVYVWLPLHDWNGRFLGQGGGGWSSGFEFALPPSIAGGYATAMTDAGHSTGPEATVDSSAWSLSSPGNVNWVLLQDFASRALDDLPKIAKSVIKAYYGKPARYSYWTGCSTGGRQGLMSAQRFPQSYDGILAAAPAIDMSSFLFGEIWPVLKMREFDYYPPPCELRAIRKAAIKACDDLDGVRDGVIAAPDLCKFDASATIGSQFDCEGEKRQVSEKAAEIANAIWEGPRKAGGKRGWHGLTRESSFEGIASTVCDESNNNCKPNPFPICTDWIRNFVYKDPKFDPTTMSFNEFWSALHRSWNEYFSIIDTADPDLSAFKAAGGKMITWHGLADELIFPYGTSDYYSCVLSLDPQARDYYRYFEAPGVAHCEGGVGAMPSTALSSLIAWVEKGIAPDNLTAATVPADNATKVSHRLLCPYPLVAAYRGGDVDEAASYECAEFFGRVNPTSGEEHHEL